MAMQCSEVTMGRFRTVAKFLTVLLCATAVAFASENEKKIQRSALPPAVEKTVQEQSQGATIKAFSMKTDKGKVKYEAEMTVNGHDKDVSIANDGTVLKVEEEVSIDTLPGTVQSVLTQRAKGANIVKVEATSKDGKLVSYEADTLKGTKKGEINVGPNGEKVADED